MRSLLTALALALCAAQAHAAVEVGKAWSRPASAGSTGVGYMVLTNRGAAADTLVSVTSPLAANAMVHQSTISGGMSSMRMIERLPLAPGASVTFGPGGYHVMFVGLKKPLNTGDSLPATLTFASGAKVTTAFPVRVDPPR